MSLICVVISFFCVMLLVCACVYVMACVCRLLIDFIGLFCVRSSGMFLSCFVFGVCFVCGVWCCCVLFRWFVVRVCVAVVVSVSCLFFYVMV